LENKEKEESAMLKKTGYRLEKGHWMKINGKNFKNMLKC
jgi:hypothetical protein